MIEVKAQWKRTVNSLQEVLILQSGKVTEIDEIHMKSVRMLANLSQDESDGYRYGRTIQKFAKRIQEYLQDHHAWHDPRFAECTCCQRQNLHSRNQIENNDVRPKGRQTLARGKKGRTTRCGEALLCPGSARHTEIQCFRFCRQLRTGVYDRGSPSTEKNCLL